VAESEQEQGCPGVIVAPHGPWEPASPAEVAAVFAGLGGPWWIAGGMAIELAAGRPFRDHGDIDVLILRRDHLRVQSVLAGWEWIAADRTRALRFMATKSDICNLELPRIGPASGACGVKAPLDIGGTMPRVNPRNPEKDPAAFLGEQLKRARLKAGYKIQDAFATAAHISQDPVSKAETGAQPPVDDVFDKRMELCHVTRIDLTRFKGMLRLARNSKDKIVDDYEPWPTIEQKASFLRSWNLMLVPGLLQDREYALRLFLAAGKTSDEAAELCKPRLARQDIFVGPDRVTGVFLLDESVLYREVESPAVMVRQLDHMLKLLELPNVTVQIVRGSASLAGMFGAFEIAGGEEIPDTMLTWAVRDQTTNDNGQIREAILIFELIRGRALNVEGVAGGHPGGERALEQAAVTPGWRKSSYSSGSGSGSGSGQANCVEVGALPGASRRTATRMVEARAWRRPAPPARSWSATPSSTGPARSCGQPRLTGPAAPPPSAPLPSASRYPPRAEKRSPAGLFLLLSDARSQ
jgi:hypothetical protein